MAQEFNTETENVFQAADIPAPDVYGQDRMTWRTKWNWGGFMNWFQFGIGNRAYMVLLALIPLLGLVWVFIAGAQGERWALENPKNDYRDEREFRNVMDTWNRAGFVSFWLAVVVFVLYLFFIIAFGALLFNNPEFQDITGTSI
jgi:hypothetical protein